MKLNDFISGNIISADGFNQFTPNKLEDISVFNGNKINLLQSKSSWYLGRLNALSKYLPDSNLFYMILLLEEAKKSNEIEGTQSDLNGIPVKKIEQPEDKLVINYLKAFNKGVDYLKENDFSIELILELHKMLFNEVQADHIEPGQFKNRQNWIGGSSKHDARFIPPPPKETVSLMEDLIKFINNEDESCSDLIKIGLIHYQFETIHPFNDGNGRIGRMLIGLYLIKKEIISHPLFISNYLSKNRNEYYFNLDSVRYRNELEQWILFFMNAIKEAAKETLTIIEKVMDLKKRSESKINEEFGGNSHNPKQILEFFFRNAISSSKVIHEELKLSKATIISLLAKLEELNIIEEITNQKRNKIYVFEDYMAIFKNLNTNAYETK